MYSKNYMQIYRAFEGFKGLLLLSNDVLISQNKGSYLVISGTGKEAPNIIIRVEPEWVTLAVSFESPEGIMRLRNVLNMKGNHAAFELVSLIKKLDSKFKTKLQRKIDDPRGLSYVDVKSFISNKIDDYLLKQLIIEAESMRQELFKLRGSNSKISPSISLAHIQIDLAQDDPLNFVSYLKDLYEHASNLRGRAATPPPKIDKRKLVTDSYRLFIGMLNQARHSDLISPEKRRDLERRWRENPEQRQEVVEEVSSLLKTKL